MATKTLKKRNNQIRKKNRETVNINNNSGKIKIKHMDYTFLVLVVIMVCFGAVMVLSASAPTANSKLGDSYRLFIKQLIASGIGFCGMLVISRIDYRRLKNIAGTFLFVCILLLIAVLIPGIGSSYNGARRWIELPFFQIQPSEFAKIGIALYFAKLVDQTKGRLTKLGDLKPYIGCLGVVIVLMVLEPHLSGTIVICGIAATILIVGGLNIKYVFGGLITGIIGISSLIALMPNRRARFLNFLDPFTDVKGMGWQVIQALYAIGSGGVFGLGLGQSRQKYSYLPEPYNDFIFAVICEELGMLGAIIVILLFIGFMIRGMKIAMEAPDTFGTLLVTGIVAQVVIQAILNIAVATSSVPNTGVSLPFFSYGGTAMMMLLCEMGLILSVSRFNRKKI